MKARRLRPLQRLADLDARLFLALNSVHRHLNVERLVRSVSFTGDGYLYVALGLTLPVLFPQTGTWFLVATLLAFLLELPLYWVLKNAFKRRRPFHVVRALAPILKPSDEFSFPSGHTTAAFMVAALMTTFFPASATAMYIWACAVGLSRVMLKVHFLSDVLAGMLLGTFFAALSLGVLYSWGILG